MEERIIPMQSETIGKLALALSKFQGSLKQPKLNKSVTVRTKEGGSYKFQYADLGACINAAAPELQKNELAVFQTIQGSTLVTTLSHSSGEFINSLLPLNQQMLLSVNFQGIGSMITYMKRYAYCAILGIVADEDDDTNTACGNEYQYKNGQAAAKPASATQNAGMTGTQLKNIIAEVEKMQAVEDVLQYWSDVIAHHPAMKDNERFKSAIFQRASTIGLAELETCTNYDEVDLLIKCYQQTYPAIIKEKTPLGNAINVKLQELNKK